MIDVCDIQVMKPMCSPPASAFQGKEAELLIAPWVPQSIAEQAGSGRETVNVLGLAPASAR